MLIDESTEDQQLWIEFILSYENWRMDKTPNKFNLKYEGTVYWLKSNGQQRIRVSPTYVEFYKKADGIELTHFWKTATQRPEENIKPMLDSMYELMLKGREWSLSGKANTLEGKKRMNDTSE